MKSLVVEFIRSADNNAPSDAPNGNPQDTELEDRPSIVRHHPPKKLQHLLASFALPNQGAGRDGLITVCRDILDYSVNTWGQGFLDKLYASPTPVGLAADLLLSALNTNVHVYEVSPALTLIEKGVCRALARMFGHNSPYAGGVSQPGGSAANQSSMVIARNTLFPDTKTEGYGCKRFVVFTSKHGHYSVEKAAQMLGFGSNAVRDVPVDEQGRMQPEALEAAINTVRTNGETPFYVNATAGTTVLGSFDHLDIIADICQKHQLWMHVDGSWGGAIIFSKQQCYKLQGIERADSIAICPHKMMNVPLTCSLLIGKDLRQFHKSMTLDAGYLFHHDDEHVANSVGQENGVDSSDGPEMEDFWDLGELVPQCGRRGDSLKLALSWIYYGTSGYAAYIDHGFAMASYLAALVSSHPSFSLISENPPPCLQVCFYFNKQTGTECQRLNSLTTEQIRKALVAKAYMIDYAPGVDGKFFRVVVNGQTRKETVECLVKAIDDVGTSISI